MTDLYRGLLHILQDCPCWFMIGLTSFAGMSTYFCDRWHLNIVSRDSFLDLVYWKDNEHKRPHDYYTRDYTIELDGGEDPKIYRYTSEDGYLAVFMRTFFIHGLDISLVCIFNLPH